MERVTAQQRLNTRAHHWRAPDPGDVVPAKWDPAKRKLRLELGRDLRYDEKLIKRLGRSREALTYVAEQAGHSVATLARH